MARSCSGEMVDATAALEDAITWTSDRTDCKMYFRRAAAKRIFFRWSPTKPAPR